MKLRMMIATAAMVITANQAMAQDESLIFQCESLPNVDSSLTLVGVADEFTSDLHLVVLLQGEVLVQDVGTLDQNATKYEGQVFDIEFSQPSKLTAKAANPVLSVGQSDSFNCQFPALQD